MIWLLILISHLKGDSQALDPRPFLIYSFYQPTVITETPEIVEYSKTKLGKSSEYHIAASYFLRAYEASRKKKKVIFIT